MNRTFVLLLAAAFCFQTAFSETSRVYIGAKKSGIYFADFDSASGCLTTPELAIKYDSSGFIAIHPEKPFLYLTGVAAFKINKDGTLTLLNEQQTEGRGSCHVSIDASGRCVMTAYYQSGGVASFQVLDDGSLSEAASCFQHEGSGAHPKRQKGPHAHSVFLNPENTHAYVPDLGIDQVIIYKLDPDRGVLSDPKPVEVPGGGMGPRHMKWSADGKFAYVLNELALSLSVFEAAGNGQMTFVRTESVFPEDAPETEMTCAEIRIHPSGKFIYTSNRDLAGRGRDSISVFSRFEDGFKRVETVPAEVWFPRNFNLDPSGNWLLVGGERSKDIAVFRVDAKTGHIEFTGTNVPLGVAVSCIEFYNR